MNFTRQIYRKIIGGARPTEEKQDDIIAASRDFKNMLKHPGYLRLQKFIETQRQGTQQYMQHEATSINAFSFVWLFNTFIKYLGVLLENRAYNRIDTYIRVTIERGEKAAVERAKREEKENAKRQKQQGN